MLVYLLVKKDETVIGSQTSRAAFTTLEAAIDAMNDDYSYCFANKEHEIIRHDETEEGFLYITTPYGDVTWTVREIPVLIKHDPATFNWE